MPIGPIMTPNRNGMRQPQDSRSAGRQQSAQSLTGELPACHEATPVRHMLDQKRGRTAELASGGEALQQTREDDRDRRENADGRVTRHQPDRQRTERHHDDRNHQRRLAAEAIGIGAEHNAADRPRQIRQTERAQRQQQRCRLVLVRKERFRDIDREVAVDGDIVPFQRVADRRRDDQLGNVLLLRLGSYPSHFGF
jgi:hypothetical protein